MIVKNTAYFASNDIFFHQIQNATIIQIVINVVTTRNRFVLKDNATVGVSSFRLEIATKLCISGELVLSIV